MKKFIKRITVFILVLICFFAAKKFFTPYYLGDKTIYAKYTGFSERPEKFNTVIFGSSRLYRQINSHLLDSLMNERNFSTYNFAAPGTFNPATYYLYENFIDSRHSKTVDRAFLELQTLSHYTGSNCTTTTASYWNNAKYLLFSLNYINHSTYSADIKKELYSCYLKSYLFGFYDFSNFLNLFRPIDMDEVGVNGFLSMEEAMNIKDENASLIERWQDFRSDTSEISERIEAANQAVTTAMNYEVNTYHQQYLTSLIEKSRNKGIELIYIIPPRLTESQYNELVPLANSLPQNHVIELYNYSDYSEFYRAAYSFDIGHLNTEGANIFTKFLAEKIKDLNTSVKNSSK